MKVKLEEFENFFGVQLIAETLEDAVNIVRLGMNHTKVLKVCDSYVAKFDNNYDAQNDQNISANIVISKRKTATDLI